MLSESFHIITELQVDCISLPLLILLKKPIFITNCNVCYFNFISALYPWFYILILSFVNYHLILFLPTYLIHYLSFLGTEWPIMCWCAVKKLLTHSLQVDFFTTTLTDYMYWDVTSVKWQVLLLFCNTGVLLSYTCFQFDVEWSEFCCCCHLAGYHKSLWADAFWGQENTDNQVVR